MADRTVPPADVVIERGALPIWTTRRTRRGKCLGRSYFDPPPEMLLDAPAAGERIALDLVRLVRAEGEKFEAYMLHNTIAEACAIAARSGEEADATPRGDAARSFSWVMSGILLGGIRHLESEKFALDAVERAQRAHVLLAELRKKERMEFVERMTAARAARALDAWFVVQPRAQGSAYTEGSAP